MQSAMKASSVLVRNTKTTTSLSVCGLHATARVVSNRSSRPASSAASIVGPRTRKGKGLSTARAMVADDVDNVTNTDRPQPIVIINNEADPLATVVTIKFGDYLGELLDTVNSLQNLKLNIVRAKFDMDGNKNKFFITCAKTGEKIFSSDRLEEIKMTIINNMMLYHPEALDGLSSFFHAKRASEPLPKLGAKGAPSVKTEISLHGDGTGIRTILEITTAETIGKAAHDVFAVTYHGQPLNAPMKTLVTNALYYYLARAEVEGEESY